MVTKMMLLERIERETEYLAEQTVGTNEYNASTSRLNVLEDKLADLEKFESESEKKERQMADEKKDRFVKNVIDVGKFVVGGVVIPIVGLVCITAAEKEITFTGALREYTKFFVPKK